MKEQKNIKNKISIWECVCPKCGNNGDFELPQGVIPKYCSRCGSEADYREVAGYETGENKKTPQDVLDLGEVEAIIITDDNGNLIAVVDNHHIIEHEGYKVIIDKKLS